MQSPVSGKKIGKEQWLQIISNKKLKNRERFKSIRVKGGFIDNSYEMFSTSFQSEVGKNPSEMIQLVLDNRENILPGFIDSLFFGVWTSEHLEEINAKQLEEMFEAFPCDLVTHRALYFLGIIEKMNSVVWSSNVISQIKTLAINHINPEPEEQNIASLEEKEMRSCQGLYSHASNCVRGCAAKTIGN